MLSKEFFTAGKAVWTVSNGKGEHYTYRITKSKDKPGALRAANWFVSVLAGPNNEADYIYIGILKPENGDVLTTRASKLKDDSKPVKVARWALQKAWKGEELPEGYKLEHFGKCAKCGRLLTHPESLSGPRAGLGPECYKTLGLG